MTKDEIFAAMEKAYTGAGSTVEGSFAGDLLRACADGCAELWSTEIDGLEERAFVASAAGEWLTRVCADRGVERRAGEDDETLRSRALESLKRQGASGNADDYAAWCGTVEDLLRVRVLPLARGAGTVDIVAVGQDGRAASAAAVAAAQSVVDEKRPIGADAKVFAAVEKPLNIAASVVLSEGASLEGVVNAFKGAFTAFCREGATTRLVSYARVSAILLDQEGGRRCDGLHARRCGDQLCARRARDRRTRHGDAHGGDGMRLPESVTKIQPVGAVLKASEAGEALLREAGERVNARLLVGQADAAGLSRWEREYGLADRSGEDGARRRARIYAAMAGGQTLTRERLSALAVAVGGADRGEVTEDFAAYAVELTAVKEGRLPAPEGMAALREAIARQKGAHLTVTAVPCAALTLDRAEALHGGALELAWGEIAEA